MWRKWISWRWRFHLISLSLHLLCIVQTQTIEPTAASQAARGAIMQDKQPQNLTIWYDHGIVLVYVGVMFMYIYYAYTSNIWRMARHQGNSRTALNIRITHYMRTHTQRNHIICKLSTITDAQ